jgi:hypothetical protein
MRRLNRVFRSTAKRLRQRGSALLASLMVIVGLSLLGLAFVAISETESAISINERNHTQTVALAESGARLVVQWFQFPDQMLTLNLMPANTNAFKTNRVVASYTGYYKPDPATKLCDLPFGPQEDDEFFGAEDSPDVIIDRSTAAGRTFLDALNTKLLGAEGTVDPRPAGELTILKIYAPPLVGSVLTAPNPPHFFQGGTRYGVATIMARAEKFDRPASVASRKSIALAECRIVVSQFPLPTPGGPLQSATALATNGNFNVHWGLVSSQQSLNLQKDYNNVPWFNAYERIHFNRGYDSSVEWTANTAYRVGDIVRPTAAQITTIPPLRAHEYTVTVAGNSGASPPPAFQTAMSSGATIAQNGVTYVERQPTAYPLTLGGATSQSNTPWLYFIGRGDISVTDPWFHARTAQNDVAAANGNAQPWGFPYSDPITSVAPLGNNQIGGTHHFQFQAFDQYPNFKQLIFPIINYDFWKAAAIAGNGQSGVKYLRWVSADQYTDGVTTQGFRTWATSRPGFYFFETQNNQNPQNGGPGILAPDVSVKGASAYMGSFIYLNAGFSTQGLNGPDGYFNQPGEPYMDIGYRQVDLSSPNGDFVHDAAGMPIVDGAVNNQWNYQDLPWSNTGTIGGGTPNGKFDVYVKQRTVHDPSDIGNPNSSYTGWFPVPYTPGCLPGDNSCAACAANPCSEPHEPYLNLKYLDPDGLITSPPAIDNVGHVPNPVTIGWFDPATSITTQRRPKKTTNGQRVGTLVTCTSASSVGDCTSNGYDLDGGLAKLPPATDGVLYCEGQFSSTGNADYYGSVLVGGGVDSQGTPNLWYDESLSRGIRLNGFPRVMITSVETDR